MSKSAIEVVLVRFFVGLVTLVIAAGLSQYRVVMAQYRVTEAQANENRIEIQHSKPSIAVIPKIQTDVAVMQKDLSNVVIGVGDIRKDLKDLLKEFRESR